MKAKQKTLLINVGAILLIIAVTVFCVNYFAGSIINEEFSNEEPTIRLKVTSTNDEVRYYSNVQDYDIVEDSPRGLTISINYKSGRVEQVSNVLSVIYVGY